MKTMFSLALCLLFVPAVLLAAEKEKPAKPTYQKFNNPICPVMNRKITGKNFVVHNGVRYELCCKSCEKAFPKNPDKYLAKLPNNGKIVEGKNTTCPVMGGAVNTTIYTVYNGTKIYFCCPGCDKTFTADPVKYMKKIKPDESLGADAQKHKKHDNTLTD